MADERYKIYRANLAYVRDQITENLGDIDQRIIILENSAGGGIVMNYKFSTSLAGTPATGHLSADSANVATVTKLFISKITDTGNDVTTILLDLRIGDSLFLTEQNPPNAESLYDIATTPVDSGTFFTIEVTHISIINEALPQDEADTNINVIAKRITDHADLDNVTPNQHHNQAHLLYGPDQSDIDTSETPVIGTGLVWTGINPAKPWEALNIWTAAAYGNIRQSVPVALPDIGLGWTLMLADSTSITAPRSVTQDFANDGIRFDVAGVFNIAVSVTIAHNESNGSRETSIRLYNQTEATGAAGTLIGIARNQGVTNFSTILLAEIDASAVGDLFQIQMGDGDTLTTVNERSFAFSVNAVSEYRG